MGYFFCRKWVLMLVVLVMFSAFGCTTTDQTVIVTKDGVVLNKSTPTSVVMPTFSPSPVTPTETATMLPPTLTDTSVPTLTELPTEIPSSPTPTEVPPIATLFGSTVCRFGPGTIYPVHTSIKEGKTAVVRGQIDDGRWYLIEFPESEETCWIFNEIVELDITAELVPILTPPAKPTPRPAPTQSEEEKVLGVKYFLIIPDNGGPFACGDGLAYFYSGKNGKGIEDDITVALNALFEVKTEYVGNYYNPVYKSSLRVRDVEVENGDATIWLVGNFVKPMSECESKRIHSQVWETARQFSEIKSRPIIWVNNALLGDLLEHIKK